MKHSLILTVLALFLLAACATPAPTFPPTATATLPPPSTPIPSPTLTPTIAPSPIPSPTPFPPLMTAAQFRLGGWSPDSRHLTFWSYTPEDIAQNPVEGSAIAAYGTFHVLDARTGGECQYPKDNALGLQFNFWHGWLPDGRLMTLDAAGELVALDQPCGGSAVWLPAEEKPACLVTNPDASESCSPGDTRRGITLGSGAAYTTTVVDVSTGKVEAVTPWQFSADGLGAFPGPLWLSEAQFIIHRTDEGPLLVTLGDQFSFPLLTGQSLLGRHRMGLAETGDRTVHL